MKEYVNNNPIFSRSIQIVETTDPAHADNINAATKQLLQNTIVNREAISDIFEQNDALYEGRDLTQVHALEIAQYSDEWAWIYARIKAHNFAGIHVADYIPITIDDQTMKMQVAGIDTYYQTGDNFIGHHIDFISKDCFNQLVKWNTTNTNNGTSAENSPYMASNLHTFLTTTLYSYLPEAVKAVIKEKRFPIENRYSSSGTLLDSIAWAWKNLGPLWVPTEYEVFGSCIWGTKGFSQGQALQYPIFSNSYLHRVKCNRNGGRRCGWWLSTVTGNSSTSFVYVNEHGHSLNMSNYNSEFYVPVCFRVS